VNAVLDPAATLARLAARRVARRQSAPSPLRQALVDPLGFLADYGKVRTQRAIEPFQVLDWHRRVLAARTGRNVEVKSRDTGSSTFWVALPTLDVLADPPGDVLVAADRFDNAANLISYARTLLVWLPDGMRPRLLKDNVRELAFECRARDGSMQVSTIEAIPGAPESGRSYRCRHLICTEMGFWEKDEDYWNAVSGTVASGGTITCESTWPRHGTQSLFGKLWLDPARGFARHFVGRRDVPWHDEAWETRRRADLTAAGFAREYPETPDEAIAAPSLGRNAVFSREALRRAHDLDDDTMPDGLEIALGPPEPGRRYLTWWDLGQSKGRGATVGVTLDVTGPGPLWFVRMIQRYEELPYPLVQRAIEGTHNAYVGETYVEVNGPGDPVIANLDVPAAPFLTTAATKAAMLSETARRMEQGWLKWQDDGADYPALAQLDLELEAYEWRDAGLVQDCVMALCGAVLCAASGGRGFMA